MSADKDVREQVATIRELVANLSASVQKCASAQIQMNNRMSRMEQRWIEWMESPPPKLDSTDPSLMILNEKVVQLESSISDLQSLKVKGEISRGITADAEAVSGRDDTPLLPVTRGLDAYGTQDLCEAEEEQPSLPESFFGYCMVLLTYSRYPWRQRGIRWLPVLLLVQTFFIFGFCESLTMRASVLHWNASKEHNPVSCMSSDVSARSEDVMLSPLGPMFRITSSYKLLAPSQPFGFVFVATAAIFLNVCSLCSLHVRVMKTIYPRSHATIAVKCLVNLSWFVQATFIPGLYTTGVSEMMAQTRDVMDIVLNSVAATFLVDIDSILYTSLLSPVQMSWYQSFAGTTGKHVNGHTGYVHALALFDLVYMFIVYCIMSFLFFNVHGEDYMLGLEYGPFALRWVLSFGVHGAAHAFIESAAVSTEVKILPCLQAFVSQALFGSALAKAMLILGGPTYDDLSLWHRCFD